MCAKTGSGFLLLIIPLLNSCLNSVFFQPDKKSYQVPKGNYETVNFRSHGETLHAWFIPAKNKAKGTVIQFHGNAQNMSAHYSFVDWLPEQGYNLFVFDYRGYGQSTGKPSRIGLYHDSIAALNYLKSRKDIDSKNIFVIAQSLGAAFAINAIGRNDFDGIRGIVLDSPFYSFTSIVRSKLGLFLKLITFPVFPLFVTPGLSSASAIKEIKTPILFIHGTQDRVIPIRQAIALYAQANNPKQFISVKNGSHCSALGRFKSTYGSEILKFFDAQD
ncbi:MAG: alpha/beta hydrolase [Lentisphaeria bacterium]|nr:alpha/beta hydrolase [Lentisphaeria bacterium]NQZ66680.1 alpha/beta hydrolase [Lentisphaeria bacterium]